MLTPGRAAQSAIWLIAVATLAASSCSLPHRATSTSGYCAAMSDVIGMYSGNTVTRMGVPIGTIERIDGGAMSVKVTFKLNPGIAVPIDVTAVTRSPTILADRSLELTGGTSDGKTLQPGACIPETRTATAKSISEGIAAFTTITNQVTDAGHGNTIKRIVDAASSQLDGNGAAMRDSMKALAATVGDTGWDAAADQLLHELPGLMTTMNDSWGSLDTLLNNVDGFDQISTKSFPALKALLGAPINSIAGILLDVATTYRDVVWNTLDTATLTTRLLSDHTGVIVMWAGTLPNILDGIRSFWARLHLGRRPIPVTSPRVAAGPSGEGQVCAQTDIDPNRKDHCGFFYGVPDGVTTVDVLQLVLNGGVKQP